MPTLFREVTDTDRQIIAPADGSDYHLGIIGSTGVVNIDLPLLSTVNLGQRFTIACQDGGASTNQINVRRQSPDLIQGATTFAINIGYGTATFLSNGRQYVVDSSSVPHVLPISGGGTGADTAEGAVDNLGLDVKEPVTVSAKENIDLTAIPDVGTDAIVIQPQNNADPVIDAYGNKVFAYDYQANDVNHLRAEATSGLIYFNPEPVSGISSALIKDDAITSAKISASFSISYQAETLSTPGSRLYVATSVGAEPVVGATLVQAVTGATATLTDLNENDSIDIESVVGTFDASNEVTGTNPDTTTFTFTPSTTLINSWETAFVPAAVTCVTSNDGTVLPLSASVMPLTANKAHFQPTLGITQGQIETLASDGWTSLHVEYARSEIVVA